MFLKSSYSFGEYTVCVFIGAMYVAQASSGYKKSKHSRRTVRVLAKKRAS